MESEQGTFAKQGAIQNRKLRREVTTISRMTHKNIVRYYQAWVEGGVSGDTGGTIPEEDDDEDEQDPNLVDAVDVLATDDDLHTDEDEHDASGGWWSSKSPPDRKDFPKRMESSSRTSSSPSSSSVTSVAWSDDGRDPSSSLGVESQGTAGKPSDKYRRTDSALSQLLQYENEQGFGVSKQKMKSFGYDAIMG